MTEDAIEIITCRNCEKRLKVERVGVYMCPSCGCRNDVEAPFVDEDEFDRFVQSVRLPRDIELVIHTGTPDCDDGGEPLLGSYVPAFEGDASEPSHSPRITLYYRTFRAMWTEDGPYDWRAEGEETLAHELEHHFSNERGHDETDEEERDEIAREAVRLLGKKEIARRATRGLARDFGEFIARTWVIWILALIAVIVTVLASR